MGVRAWKGRCGIAMRTSGGHVDVARLHIESARGWQLGELGIPFGHDETAVGGFKLMQQVHENEETSRRDLALTFFLQ